MTISHWAGGELFALSLDGASTGDVAIETTGGFSVGDDLSTAIDGFPEDQVARPGGSATFIAFDVVSRVSHGAYTSPIGAIGYLGDSAR